MQIQLSTMQITTITEGGRDFRTRTNSSSCLMTKENAALLSMLQAVCYMCN